MNPLAEPLLGEWRQVMKYTLMGEDFAHFTPARLTLKRDGTFRIRRHKRWSGETETYRGSWKYFEQELILKQTNVNDSADGLYLDRCVYRTKHRNVRYDRFIDCGLDLTFGRVSPRLAARSRGILKLQASQRPVKVVGAGGEIRSAATGAKLSDDRYGVSALKFCYVLAVKGRKSFTQHCGMTLPDGTPLRVIAYLDSALHERANLRMYFVEIDTMILEEESPYPVHRRLGGWVSAKFIKKEKVRNIFDPDVVRPVIPVGEAPGE